MNVLRSVLIVSVAALVAACSSAPSKPVTPVAPAVANVAGNWTLSVGTPAGAMELKMVVMQTGKDLNAKITDNKGTYDYNGTVNGNDIRLGHDSKNMPGMRIEYIGTVTGDTMSGKAIFGSFGEGAFTAKRF
jgi:hypothetical protein